MIERLFICVCIGLCFIRLENSLLAQDWPELTDMDRQVMTQLKGVKETPEMVFHFRTADLDQKALSKIVSRNLDQFELCEKLLEQEYEGQIHVFLYRDVADLQQTSGVPAVAFSTGTVSIHQAFDFDSVHELTHIFAMKFPRDADSYTDMFVVEGLATILAKVDEDIPIHSWAAVYKSVSRLPALIELRKAWPNGVADGVHPYHVAGSFVGFLIERYGLEKVKHWYVNATESYMVFEKPFPALEREWLQWLEEIEVKKSEREHVLGKLGLLRKNIPGTVANAKSKSLFNGRNFDGFELEDETKWRIEEGHLVGQNSDPWTTLFTKEKFPDSCGVKLKFRLVEGDAIKVVLNRDGAVSNEAIMARWATYLSSKGGGFRQAGDLKIAVGEQNELILVNQNGSGMLYLNGFLVIQCDGDFHHSAGQIGVGVEKGIIEIQELSLLQIE